MSSSTVRTRVRTRFPRTSFTVLAAVLATAGMVASPAAVAHAAAAAPKIASDQADYAPGSTVTLTGANWASAERVRIVVNDTVGQTWQRDVTVTAAADGTLRDVFSLPNYFVSDYDVTASGASGVAVATFTDTNIGTYDQCSNDLGTGYTSGDLGCRWINGNLQSNNSIYKEGDATVQRLWLTDMVPGSSHTLRITYGTTKGGKHAYDFLTTWNWSENWVTTADRCQDITGCTSASETALDIPTDPNVPSSFQPSAPGDRQFTMRGATVSSATTPAISSGTYAGDSETSITIGFTVGASNGDMCATKQGSTTCDIALWFGAHVAAQANWGLGLGAGSISGSPYHVALDALDGAAVGQRDNQMQAGVVTAIPNGTIVIVKDAVPNDAQDFSFNINNNSTISQNFSLDDDSDPTLPNTQTFSVPAGTWSASELNIPASWTLTNLVCVDPTSNSAVDLGSATATITLASSETVTCTFTDSRLGGLKIIKHLTGEPNTYDANTQYTVHYDCGTQFVGDVSLKAEESTTITGIPTGTSCTVTEPNPLPTPPAHYDYGTPTYTESSGTANDGIVTIGTGVTPVEVAVNNSLIFREQDFGSLKISKTLSNADGAAVPTSFTVNYDCGGTITGSVSVAAGGFATVNGIPTGASCTVSEPALTPIAGYTWATPVITGSPATVIGASTVEVTVANSITRDTGSLKLSKALTGGPANYTGPFTIAYDCNDGTAHDGTVSIAAGSFQTVSGIPTGTSCTVSETPPTPPIGYSFGTPTFSPSATVSIDTKGATVEVTTNNTLTRDTGSLKLSKALTGGPADYTGPFTIAYDCGPGITDSVSVAAGGSATVSGIPTGTSCTVSEPTLPTPPTGYSFGTPTFSPSATVSIDTKGATVEVTTNNTLTRDQGYLKISKVFDAKSSGFAGTFAVVYNCGAGAVTVNLSAGGSTTVGPFDTGTSCAVSEPTLPTAPSGWTFGTPSISGSPATIVKGAQAAAVEVTVTNSITRDQGYLKISKVFDAKTSGFAGTFAVVYNCGAGAVTVNLSAGGSTTVGPFDTGTSCAVSEPTLPTAPSGWTFGTPSISGSPATIVKGAQAAAVEVTVTNSIARDTGSFKISKTTSNPDGASLPAAFTGSYDCGTGYTGTFSVASGGSQTVSGIPTGNTCSVVETAPATLAGFTWAAPTYTPASIVISTKGGTFEVVVGNSITRDRGSLQISKTVSNSDGATLPASFTVNYNCGTGYTGQVSVAPGAPATVNGIPTGNTCSVTEVTPTAIPNFTWGTPTYTPASIVISTKAGTFGITVGNSITRDRGRIVVIKDALPAQGSFAFTTTGAGYNSFTLTGSTASSGNQNSQTLVTGTYTVKEATQLGWTLTGIGGSNDPSTPYNCTVSGSSGSTGLGNLGTATATITLQKGDTVTCVFENTGNGATRTQGFWATHPQLAQIAWNGGTAYGHTFPGVAATLGDTTLCGRSLTINATTGAGAGNSSLMGGFWSSVSTTSNAKTKRSSLDQARMQLLQQLLAAELNASAFGSAPSGGVATINSWEAAYCGTNSNTIKNAQQASASFNSKGDSATFTPGTSADSKFARNIANLGFWDALP